MSTFYLSHSNFSIDGSGVVNCVDHVARSSLSFRPNHCGTFRNSSQSFAEISSAADERHLEVSLVDMILVIGRRQN